MYNRYIRNDQGVYQRVPIQEQPPRASSGGEGHRENQHWENTGQERRQGPQSPPRSGEKGGLFSDLLGKLKLNEIDSGDLLLLVLLFLLFKDGEDDELLIALGLLLIL